MKKYFALLIILLFFVPPVFAGTTETSGVTAYTIADRAERSLNAASSSFYTDTDWINWIDAGVREIVNQTECLEASAISLTLSANTRRYDPAQSFLRISSVEYDNGDTTDPYQIYTLNRVHKNDLGHGSEKAGPPKSYCVWNDQIEVYPIPRSAESGTTLYVYTVSFPSGVTSMSSPIETPAYLDSALLYYAMAQAYLKARQNEMWQKTMGLFDARIKEYLTLIVRRQPLE